jgi:hypothetical protein
LADGAWESKEATCSGDEIALDFCEAECRLSARNHEVCGKHDFTSAGRRKAIDGNDHWFAAFAINKAGKAASFCAEARSLAGVDGFEICASAENWTRLPLSVGLDNSHPHRIVSFKLVYGGFESLGDVSINGVSSFRAVQGYDRNVAFGFVSDDVRHGLTPYAD